MSRNRKGAHRAASAPVTLDPNRVYIGYVVVLALVVGTLAAIVSAVIS